MHKQYNVRLFDLHLIVFLYHYFLILIAFFTTCGE